ncbi:MAG: efflux RND transporter periplasmic adaptor subunit [Saprospiraceae bacterium]|nr:MAG: efflux RND transporter periplasmic adaptor subunit [Saprospiraceae bacterium]
MRQNSPFKKLPAITFLCVLIFSACQSKKEQATAPNQNAMRGGPVEVEGFIVKTKNLAENLEVPGTLQPFEETEIRPEISGRLVSLNVQEGGLVQKGIRLAKLFDEDLQAQLKKLQVQLDIAKKTLERQQELLKISGISQQEVDLSELQVNNIKADIELVKVSISKTEIKAPYNGKLGLRYVSLGAYVTPATLITTLRQVTQLKLDFNVPEKYGNDFKKGKTVVFTVAGASRQFSATVIATETAVEAGTRSLKVRALVSANSGELLPGAFAKVLLKMGGSGQSLITPTQAVIPQARNKQVIVFKNGSPDFRVVETGLRDENFVQITKGLKEGDTVLLTGLLAIRPDSKLQLTKVE